MDNVDEIIEKIKDVISREHPGRKVFDRHVAAELGVAPTTLQTWKTRGAIPCRPLLEFCRRRWISVNGFLWNQAPSMLDPAVPGWQRRADPSPERIGRLEAAS